MSSNKIYWQLSSNKIYWQPVTFDGINQYRHGRYRHAAIRNAKAKENKFKSAREKGAFFRNLGLTIPAGTYRANKKTGVNVLLWDKKTELFLKQCSQNPQYQISSVLISQSYNLMILFFLSQN